MHDNIHISGIAMRRAGKIDPETRELSGIAFWDKLWVDSSIFPLPCHVLPLRLNFKRKPQCHPKTKLLSCKGRISPNAFTLRYNAFFISPSSLKE